MRVSHALCVIHPCMGEWHSSVTSRHTRTPATDICPHTHLIGHTHHSQQHPLIWHTLGCERTRCIFLAPHTNTHGRTRAPATEYAHSKSAWINKRWSCASQPNLWGGDSLPHRQGSAGASARDTAGFQETNLFVYCLGVLSAVTVHCSQPILGMFF